MNTITLFFGAHGSKPDTHDGRPETRSLNPHRYPRGFTVNFLSIAGYANIKTEVGLVYVREPAEEQEKIIKEIEESGYDTEYRLFTSATAQQLNGLGTDHVALSYLVPSIFRGKEITSQFVSKRIILEDMKNEMLALGMLADLRYSDTSLPEIDTNPTFEKWWWFDNNLGDDRRKFNTKKRTGIARAAGNTEDNPILSTNGLFILHTTNAEHSPFSISNIHASSDYEFANKKDGLRIITPVAIKRRNLLRKINYTSYWKKWIEAFDFRAVPDQDVLEIGSIEEAVFIVKQIYYAFLHDATDDPADPDVVAEIEEDKYVNEGEGVENPVAKCESSAQSLSLSQPIIQKLKELILPQADKATELIKLSEAANITVQTQRDDLRTAGDAADELERQIEERKQQIQTRHNAQLIYEMTAELALADEQLEGLRGELTKAKEDSAKLESQLVQLQREIVANVTTFISELFSKKTTAVKAAIKNIIMRNKLKNILKFGIFHKRLSLSQIILFFRSLGYDIINIVDPTCSVLKPPRLLETDIHSQDMGGSQEGIDIKPKRKHRVPWVDELNGLAVPVEGDGTQSDKRSATAVSQNGGTKRKRSYSRKRRTRRKRCATRRYRRRRK